MPDAASSGADCVSRVTVRPAQSRADFDAVRALCWEYRDFLETFGPEQRRIVRVFYPHDDYAALMDRLEEEHARPRGIVLVAEVDGVISGCGMSHALNETAAEIKRVFMRPEARGTGAAKALSRALIDQARADGFDTVFLDTSQDLLAARGLYESLGFRSRGPYAPVPEHMVPLLCFYELSL
ncbi:GNAT family N-acetyltransferase [Sulfitobacter sp. D35]|uniref:GNAT family N-acetyltransferase n=1 Tax=Sulfitobacter sp. D35 TaxID=3083252 RepID=UPI00296EC4B9|nr:GNAT family N-acetyltransferase [Sulfitobacter sp. D35]MDW4497600.1 GNAT family N-acetyltransferase [Sulfitobacter sp. D35]